MDAQLRAGEHLEKCEKQQRQPRTHHRAPGSGLRLNALLLLRDGNERKLHTAERQHIPKAHNRQALLLSVHKNAARRARVHDRPTAVVIAREHSVCARDRRILERHVAALAASDEALPVHDRNTVSRRPRQPRPDLRLAPEHQKGFSAADENHERQQRKDIAKRPVQLQKRRGLLHRV